MRKLKKILLSTILALTVSTAFFASTSGTRTVTAASGTTVKWKGKVIAYQTGSVYNFVPRGSAADNRRALNSLMEGNKKKVININHNIHIDTYLRPGNNTTINAGRHTITSDKGVIINDPTAASYSNFKNLTINGGIWKNSSSKGLDGTMMRISYASNISINNATVYANYKGHGIELISCSNVVVNHCTLKARGSCPKTCVEEQLQIDLSTPTTAPGLYRLSKKLCNGTPCKNITVKNCTVQGGRGICANFANAGNESKYRRAGNYHSNIRIEKCTVTGISAEAVALFNTKSATVKNCRITAKTPTSRSYYSVGLAVAYAKGSAPKANTKNVISLTNNTVKGGLQGIFVRSNVSQKLGTVIVSGNTVYAKKGKSKAIRVSSAKKTKITKNKTGKW